MSETRGRWLSNVKKAYLAVPTCSVYRRIISERKCVGLQFKQPLAIGEPKATEKYSTAELEAMGMVGVYAPGGES